MCTGEYDLYPDLQNMKASAQNTHKADWIWGSAATNKKII